MTECECNGPGFCKRHGINKNEAWFKLCKTRPKYFASWEAGNGPGQNIPKTERQGPPKPGPGTELKAILRKLGITRATGCHCDEHVSRMNEWGPDGCIENMETIIGWLREEASKKPLPYLGIAGRVLVKLAVRRTRKKLIGLK